MKRLIVTSILILAVFTTASFSGEIRSTPQYIVLTQPTTNQVELIYQKHFYGSSPYLEIKYHVLDTNGSVRATHLFRVEDADYTAFVDTYGATMKSRGDTEIWQHIQSIYTTQATP